MSTGSDGAAAPLPNIPAAPPIPGFTPVYSGKVRDLYRSPEGALLFVASDRISAYDWVLPTTIPDKGAILTQLSLWWFEQVADIVGNHVLPGEVPAQVAGRAMLCQPLAMFPVECVARGYLTGSGLVEYRASGEVCGVALPRGSSTGRGCPSPSSPPPRRPSSAPMTRTWTSRPWWPPSARTTPRSCAASPWRCTGGPRRSPASAG